MLVRMLVVLRVERGRRERAEVGVWHLEVGYLETRIVGCYGRRN